MAGYPTSARGWLVTITAVLILVIAVFASGLWTIIVGGVLVAAVAYFVYILGVNIHSWATTQYDRRGGQ